MIWRNPFEAASNAAAVQRSAIDPLCQFFTRRIRSRAAEWPLSMRFVVPRQRRSTLGSPAAPSGERGHLKSGVGKDLSRERARGFEPLTSSLGSYSRLTIFSRCLFA